MSGFKNGAKVGQKQINVTHIEFVASIIPNDYAITRYIV